MRQDSDGDKMTDGEEIGTIFDPTVNDSDTLAHLATRPELYLDLVSSTDAVVPEVIINKNESGEFEIIIQIDKTEDLKIWEAMDLSGAVVDGKKNYCDAAPFKCRRFFTCP